MAFIRKVPLPLFSIALLQIVLLAQSCSDTDLDRAKDGWRHGKSFYDERPAPPRLVAGALPPDPVQLANIPMAPSIAGGNLGLPPKVDLTEIIKFPPVGSQDNQPSCVAFAVAYGLKTYQEEKERGWGADARDHQFSPAFIYNQRPNRSLPFFDRGMWIHDALNIVKANGCATLADMPYRDWDDTTQPSIAVQKEAKRFRILDYGRVDDNDIDKVKEQLWLGKPVVFGAELGEGVGNLLRSRVNKWSRDSAGKLQPIVNSKGGAIRF